MRELAEVKAIIEQYAKHDWTVRRLMLSPASIADLGYDLTSTYADVQIIESPSEGIWFSRRTLPDREA